MQSVAVQFPTQLLDNRTIRDKYLAIISKVDINHQTTLSFPVELLRDKNILTAFLDLNQINMSASESVSHSHSHLTDTPIDFKNKLTEILTEMKNKKDISSVLGMLKSEIKPHLSTMKKGQLKESIEELLEDQFPEQKDSIIRLLWGFGIDITSDDNEAIFNSAVGKLEGLTSSQTSEQQAQFNVFISSIIGTAADALNQLFQSLPQSQQSQSKSEDKVESDSESSEEEIADKIISITVKRTKVESDSEEESNEDEMAAIIREVVREELKKEKKESKSTSPPSPQLPPFNPMLMLSGILGGLGGLGGLQQMQSPQAQQPVQQPPQYQTQTQQQQPPILPLLNFVGSMANFAAQNMQQSNTQ